MTDNDHDQEAMTDHTEIPDDGLEAETFDKETRRRLGQRGEEHLGHIREQTDLDGMTKVEDVNIAAYCSCGTPFQSVDDTYRCCQCDDMCCTACHIEMTRRHYCPDCAEQAYGLTKPTYIALYLLDKGELEPDDLVTADPIDTDLDAVTIDPAATTIIDHQYIRTGDTELPTADPTAALSDEDDPLTAAGQEALHVGDQLYSDDPDVEALEDELAIREATTR